MICTTRKERTKYRSTKVWKTFRSQLIEQAQGRCFLCGQKYYGKQKKYLQIHHLDPECYDDLDPNKFIVLNSACHDLVETVSIKILGTKSDSLLNLEHWVRLLWPAFPFRVRQVIQDKYGVYLSTQIPEDWAILQHTTHYSDILIQRQESTHES
jgi:hypothetical protein